MRFLYALIAVLLAAFVLLTAAHASAHQKMDGYRSEVIVKGKSHDSMRAAKKRVRRLLHKAVHRGHGRIVIRIRRDRTAVLFSGSASWYGPGFDGNGTACGEVFDQDALTAAHRTLPCGTRLIVSHGGNEVAVRINDRGPFVEGRVLDLSRAAFEAIAPLGAGHVHVEARRP